MTYVSLLLRADEFICVAEGYADQLEEWAKQNPPPAGQVYKLGDASFDYQDSRKDSVKLASTRRFAGQYSGLFLERPAEKNISPNPTRMLAQLNGGQKRTALAFAFIDTIILCKEQYLFGKLTPEARKYVISEITAKTHFGNYQDKRCRDFVQNL